MSNTTDTTVVAKAKLSCNHVQEVGPSVNAGDRITCERCTKGSEPRVRRVKKVTPMAPTPADEVQAAEARIAELAADHEARGADPELANRMAEADAELEASLAATPLKAALTPEAAERLAADMVAETLAQAEADGVQLHPAEVEADVLAALADAGLPAEPQPEPQPAPEADQGYDVLKARDEWRALKVWQEGGQQGTRPDTTNLDAQAEAHAAGRPRPKAGKAAERKARVVNPRRAEANTARKAKGFGGRTAVRFTADELDAYIRKVRAEHPTSSREDELEYAYWVIEMKISRGRWNTAWDATLAD